MVTHGFNSRDLEPRKMYKSILLYNDGDERQNPAPKNVIRGIFFANFDQTIAQVYLRTFTAYLECVGAIY